MNSIVIGSGFGGMAAALRLKAKGHNVTLIEKHEDLGGRARVFKKNGFTDFKILRGGLDSWKQENLPIEQKK